MIITLGILFVISFIERDLLSGGKISYIAKFIKLFSEGFYNWYTENRWETKSWWLKVPLSMFLDGKHFWITLGRLNYFYIMLTLLSSRYVFVYSYFYLLLIGCYVISGVLLGLSDKTLFQKRNL